MEGQAFVHILVLSALRGLTVRGPIIGTEQAFVLVRDWLGEPPEVTDRDTAFSDRTPILGGNQTVVTKNGIFRPFAQVDGRAVAIWGLPRGRITLEPFGRLAAPVRSDLDREAADVERFLAPSH